MTDAFNLDRPRINVDFNEMVEDDLVLLSKYNAKEDSAGRMVELREGLSVFVFMDDSDEHGSPGALIADGLAERITGVGWDGAARWACRLDAWGIRRWP